ncbi:MAG: hypothetical protein C0524_05790 [Rhodobacter sp.]|nr:hypothetical protein [Rhodobacter sp.]
MLRALIPLLAILALPAVARADPPEVVAATATQNGGTWSFDVTLAHPDTGWDHYADAWQIETADGTVLGIRELAHPHVEEQPFTRSLSGVTLPEGLEEVVIRPRCLVDGWAGESFRLRLP